MRRIVRVLVPIYLSMSDIFQIKCIQKKYTIAKSDISKEQLKILLDEWILPW